jgi:hypothetical protein
VSNNIYSCAAIVYPRANENITLASGSSTLIPQYNISVSCQYPDLATNRSLAFGENYSNSNINFFINCPAYPKKNITFSPSYGQNQTDLDSNLSCNAPQYPRINENLNLSCGTSKTYYDLGLSISTVPCIGINRDLEHDETFTRPEYGLTLRAPPKLNKSIGIGNNDTYTNSDIGLNVSCSIAKSEFLAYCMELNDAPIAQVWQAVNTSDNLSCTLMHNTCIEGMASNRTWSLAAGCTLEEKTQGDYGLVVCQNRRDVERNAVVNTSIDKENICQTQLSKITNGNEDAAAQSEANQNVMAMGIGGGIMLFALFFGVTRWLDAEKKKKVE